MKNYIDVSKLKTFSLDDLVGRTVSIRCFRDSSEDVQMLMAFDTDTNESFLIKVERLPKIGGYSFAFGFYCSLFLWVSLLGCMSLWNPEIRSKRMGKRVSVLGCGVIKAAMIHALSNMGHEVMVEDKPKQTVKRKQYAPLDMSDYKKPVNGYQAKQRKRKAKRRVK